METLLLFIWLGGWVALTVAAAMATDPKDDMPLFVWPLMFGFLWPPVLALGLIMGGLTAISHWSHRNKKQDPTS